MLYLQRSAYFLAKLAALLFVRQLTNHEFAILMKKTTAVFRVTKILSPLIHWLLRFLNSLPKETKKAHFSCTLNFRGAFLGELLISSLQFTTLSMPIHAYKFSCFTP
jgi:hypothetical protein